MIQFTARVLLYESGMGPLEIRRLYRALSISGSPTKEDLELHAAACLGIWLARLLRQLKWLDSDQRYYLLEEMRPAITVAGEQLSRETVADDPKRSQYQVIFMGARYVTWTGTGSMLDLRKGEYIGHLPYPEIESLAYNLTELFRREMARCFQLQIALSGGQDAGVELNPTEPLSGGVDKP